MKKIDSFFLMIALFFLSANHVFAFETIGEVKIDSIQIGQYQDFLGSNEVIKPTTQWEKGKFSWKLKDENLYRYNIRFYCSRVADYEQASIDTYPLDGTYYQTETNSFSWDLSEFNSNSGKCFCQGKIIIIGKINNVIFGTAWTAPFLMCEPSRIKPIVKILEAQEQENGMLMKMKLESAGNVDKKNLKSWFEIFPKDILKKTDENGKLLIFFFRETSNNKGSWDWQKNEYTLPIKYLKIKQNEYNGYCYQAFISNDEQPLEVLLEKKNIITRLPGTGSSKVICFGQDVNDDKNLISLAQASILEIEQGKKEGGNSYSVNILASLDEMGNDNSVYAWIDLEGKYDQNKTTKYRSSKTERFSKAPNTYSNNFQHLYPDFTYCAKASTRSEAGFNSGAEQCFATPGQKWIETLPLADAKISLHEIRTQGILYSLGAGAAYTGKGKIWIEWDLCNNITERQNSGFDLKNKTKELDISINRSQDVDGIKFSGAFPADYGQKYCYRAVAQNEFGIKRKGEIKEIDFWGEKTSFTKLEDGLRSFDSKKMTSTLFVRVLTRNNLKSLVIKYRVSDPVTGRWDGLNEWNFKQASFTASVPQSDLAFVDIPIQQGSRYCYKAIFKTDDRDYESDQEECFIVPFRPKAKTDQPDFGSDLKILYLRGVGVESGYENVKLQDGRRIGDLVLEDDIMALKEKYFKNTYFGYKPYFIVYPSGQSSENSSILTNFPGSDKMTAHEKAEDIIWQENDLLGFEKKLKTKSPDGFYCYKLRLKNAYWFDNSSDKNNRQVCFKMHSYPNQFIQNDGRSGFWSGCYRGARTTGEWGCADTSFSMALNYWYKNNDVFKNNWDKFVASEKIPDTMLGYPCRIPKNNDGQKDYSPNPYTVLYFLNNKEMEVSDSKLCELGLKTVNGKNYCPLMKNGAWNTWALVEFTKSLGLSMEPLTGIIPIETGNLNKKCKISFQEFGELIGDKGAMGIIRRSGSSGTGHWLMAYRYDAKNKLLYLRDTFIGSSNEVMDENEYNYAGFGTENNCYDRESDNYLIYPMSELLQPVVEISKSPAKIDANNRTVTIYGNIKAFGSNILNLKTQVFYWEENNAWGTGVRKQSDELLFTKYISNFSHKLLIPYGTKIGSKICYFIRYYNDIPEQTGRQKQTETKCFVYK